MPLSPDLRSWNAPRSRWALRPSYDRTLALAGATPDPLQFVSGPVLSAFAANRALRANGFRASHVALRWEARRRCSTAGGPSHPSRPLEPLQLGHVGELLADPRRTHRGVRVPSRCRTSGTPVPARAFKSLLSDLRRRANKSTRSAIVPIASDPARTLEMRIQRFIEAPFPGR